MLRFCCNFNSNHYAVYCAVRGQLCVGNAVSHAKLMFHTRKCETIYVSSYRRIQIEIVLFDVGLTTDPRCICIYT